MNKFIEYTGMCEEQKKNFSVYREMIDASTMSSIEYAKGRLYCEYDKKYGCKYYDENGKCSLEG